MRRKLGVMIVAVAIVTSAGAQAMACNCKNKKGQGAGKVSAPAKTDALAQSLIKPYLAIRGSLAADKLDGVSANVAAMKKALQTGVADAKKSKKPSHYTDSLEKTLKSVKVLEGSKAKTLSGARDAFGGLSESIVEYVRGNVSSADAAKYQLFYCEMAKHNWLQTAGEKKGNPYYGKSMADCGEKQAINSPCGSGSCDGAGCSGASCGDNSKPDHSMHKHGM